MYRKIVVLAVCSFLIFSCSSSPKGTLVKSKCNENLVFKKIFFEKIKNVDTFMIGETDIKNLNDVENFFTQERVDLFDSSLLFISKYSKVSYESMLNYARSYPYDTYKNDRANWTKWYDENKCNNIQLKDLKLNKTEN